MDSSKKTLEKIVISCVKKNSPEETDKEIIVSSSIPAIEESKQTKLSLNENALEEYLAFRHVMGAKTFYKEVKSVAPGQIIKISSNISTEYSYISEIRTKEKRSLKEILLDSLSLINESESQPGILLSGGVDSTLLLALLSKELGERELKTYTLDTGLDAKWAQKAATQFGTHHHAIQVSPEILNRIDEYLLQSDQPVGDHGAFATWLVAEQAVKDSNVLFLITDMRISLKS